MVRDTGGGWLKKQWSRGWTKQVWKQKPNKEQVPYRVNSCIHWSCRSMKRKRGRKKKVSSRRNCLRNTGSVSLRVQRVSIKHNNFNCIIIIIVITIFNTVFRLSVIVFLNFTFFSFAIFKSGWSKNLLLDHQDLYETFIYKVFFFAHSNTLCIMQLEFHQHILLFCIQFAER